MAIKFGDFREESGYIAAKFLLSLQNGPTAIFIANSEMTGGAMGALREHKIRMPEQLSVIGFDDARWARYLDPPLTVIAQPTEAMGRCAAELLLACLEAGANSRKAKIRVFLPKLIVRRSTAAFRPIKAAGSNV